MPSIISIGASDAPLGAIVEPTVLAPGLPSPRSISDWMLLWTVCKKPTAAFSYPAGWQVIYDVVSAIGRHGLLAYRVDGAETTPSISWSGMTTGTGGSTSQAVIVNVGTGYHESGTDLVVDVVGDPEDGAAHIDDMVGGTITTLTDGAILFSQSLRLHSSGTAVVEYAGASGLLFVTIVADLISNGALLAAQAWVTQPVAGDADNQSVITGGSATVASAGVIVAIQPTPPPPPEQTDVIEYTLTQ